MDFSTMRQKLNDHEYDDLEDLEVDFNLMLSNCMAYNSKETVCLLKLLWDLFSLFF